MNLGALALSYFRGGGEHPGSAADCLWGEEEAHVLAMTELGGLSTQQSSVLTVHLHTIVGLLSQCLQIASDDLKLGARAYLALQADPISYLLT